MNLYLISQEVNNDYDTYDSAVVIAKNVEAARRIYPSEDYIWSDTLNCFISKHDSNKIKSYYSSWAEDIKDVYVTYIGKARVGAEPGVILASFNAG